MNFRPRTKTHPWKKWHKTFSYERTGKPGLVDGYLDKITETEQTRSMDTALDVDHLLSILLPASIETETTRIII